MTFDLKKVQAAIEEAVDRLNQKIDDEDGPIWEKEPEKAAALQTLLAEITHLEKWVIKNRDIATDLQYQLDDEVKENNQLRTELEKWLKKERSARLLENSSSIRLAYLKANDIDFDEFFDGKALEQLQAEGKIGPDADAA